MYYHQMLNIPNKNILIDWTPKSGCTTVCKMIFKYLGILDEALKYSKWIHDYRMHKYYSKYGEIDKESLLHGKYSKYLIIKFVRNPYSRAVSSYIHAMKSIKLIELIGLDNISFIHFLTLIRNKNITVEEGHWRIQKLSYENDNNKKNLNIKYIKIENIKDELNILKKNNNIDLYYDFTSNHHIKKKDNINKFVGNIKFKNLNNKFPKYRYFYNDKIRKLVEEIYFNDIKTYNYSYDEFLKDN